MTIDAQQIAVRYVALWNDSNPETRRATIKQLWLEDGQHFVRTLKAQGYDALEKRVTGSHEKNVRDGGFEFRCQRNAQHLQDTITFNWEMIRPSSGEVVSVGLEFLKIDEAGRIATDYQFIIW